MVTLCGHLNAAFIKKKQSRLFNLSHQAATKEVAERKLRTTAVGI